MKTHQIARELRQQKHQSQKQVYTAIGMPQQTYSGKECGNRPFTDTDIASLAKHHQVPESYFKEEQVTGVDVTQAIVTLQNSQLVIQTGQLALWQKLERIEKQLEEERKKPPVKRKRK